MKKCDFIFWAVVILLLLPFFVSDAVYEGYKSFNGAHPYLMAFLKFMILSSIGEMLGLRIKQGVYTYKGYGILSRAIVWGVLGVMIAVAMKIFASGVPVMLESWGLEGMVAAMGGDFSIAKLFDAFCISTAMNTFFAPMFMTLHKVTDTHILNCGGKITSLVTPIKFGEILASLNWRVQWGFVFKRTLPLFWIPAHTITFLLPTAYQVLFAASLSIVLGVLLSVAAVMSNEKQK
ncbi:MAG: hypothetical protein IJZ22_03055 [Bacteroidaceae bacterium]|nr:hypothetical protein [Bacteroidaceae bacterium]